jgi:hypothetical protein
MFSLAMLFAVGLVSGARAQGCGELKNAYGPFDYRTATEVQRITVEKAHFTPRVEALTEGESTAYIGGDLDYTLRAFPNHPRALLALVKLAEREARDPPRGSRYTVDCWFDRAIRFAPNDGQVRVIYGVRLLKQGRTDAAVEQLEQARKIAGDDPNVHYNLGLAYFDLKDYDKALQHAHEAYRLGFPLPGLRNKLKQSGMWREPTSAAKQ